MDFATGPPAAYESGADRLRRLERSDTRFASALAKARGDDPCFDPWDLMGVAIAHHLLCEVADLIDPGLLPARFGMVVVALGYEPDDFCYVDGDALYLGRSRTPLSLSATLSPASGAPGARLRDLVIALALLCDRNFDTRLLAAVSAALPGDFAVSEDLSYAIREGLRCCWVPAALETVPVAEFVCRVGAPGLVEEVFAASAGGRFAQVMYMVVGPTPQLLAVVHKNLWSRGRPAPETCDVEEVNRAISTEIALCGREAGETTGRDADIARCTADRLGAWLAWRRGAPMRALEPRARDAPAYRNEKPSKYELVARCYALADAGATHDDFLRGGAGASIYHIAQYLHEYADFSIYPRVYGLDAFADVVGYVAETVEIDAGGDRLYILNDGPRPLAATVRSELGPYMIIIAANRAAWGRQAIMQAVAPHVETVQPWLAALILTANLTQSGGCREIADFFAARTRPDAFAAVMTQVVNDALARPRNWPLHGDELIFELARRCGPATERAVAAWNVAPPPRDRRRALG